MDTVALLADTFAPMGGKRLLDIGCGGGHLARALGKRGAVVTGIDPDPSAVETAREVAPEARFEVATATRLPFEDGAFEGAVFLNSLHHIASSDMAAALSEAARITRQDGLVVVVEPLASGSFFDAFRPIEDETAVRRDAQSAVEHAAAGGALRKVTSLVFDRVEDFVDFAQFADRATAAAPERRAIITRDRSTIEAAFRQHAGRTEAGRFRLVQPLKADTFAVMR